MKAFIPALLLAVIVTLPAHAVIVSYSFDTAGRLTAANYGGTSRTAYAYDKNGNLLSRTNTTNVVPALAGTYNGLLENASPDITNLGPITLKMGINGSFSGKVTLEGKSYSFAGVFAANGTTGNIIIDRKPPLNDLTLTLTLDVTNGTGQIAGTITDGGFTSSLQLDRAAYDTKNLLPGGLVGKYTALLLPTQTTAGIPQGDGYATVAVSSSGGIMLAGKLANNVGITQSSTFVDGNLWPLFVPLHTSKGYLSGLVTFESDPGNSDFDGFLAWVKPVTTGTFHPAAFTTHLTLIGSRWDAPAKGQTAIAVRSVSPNLTFNATEGDLAGPVFLNTLTLDSANKFIIPTNAAKLKLSVTTTSGVLTGSFVDGTKTRTLSGVLLQEWNSGSGFFPGTTVSGLFEIEQAP